MTTVNPTRSNAPTAVVEVGSLIGGNDVFSGRTREVRNPGRLDEVVGLVDESDAALVDDAVRAAVDAQQIWVSTSVPDRVAILGRIADAIDESADAIATVVAREGGSVLPILRRELGGAATVFRHVADFLADALGGATHETAGGDWVRVERRPYGVVGCVVPWNAPILLTANKLAPAIAAGNAVILKPSPLAPLGVTLLGRIVASFLPPGTLNVVNGAGDVGAAIIDHPAVRKISFTGGGATARTIMRQAADTLTGVHFELGGNDPAIVLDDANLDAAAERIVQSAFRRSGQVCFAVKRVYVPDTLAMEFGERLVEHVGRLRVGDALDPRATMGPMNNAAQLATVAGLIDRTRAAGRDVRVLGTVLEDDSWDGGHFIRPAVVLDAQHDDDVVSVEQFGPILPVIAYRTEDEAVRFANDTEYGLCSSVWSASRERAIGIAARIEAGVTFVNNHLFSATGSRHIPFGGVKQSGIGWEGSPAGIDEYLEYHSVDVFDLPASVR